MGTQKPPNTIYLQIGEFPDTTWCVDRINDDDVEYALVSQYDEMAVALRNLLNGVYRLPPLTAIEGILIDQCKAAEQALAIREEYK